MIATVSRFNRNLLPPPRSFYLDELGKLTRPNSKGWALGRCPFHPSKSGKSFAVNSDSGGFFCFGCGVKGGDLISYIRQRDHVDFPTACKLLGCWSPVTAAERLQLDREADRRRREREEAAKAAELARQQRIILRGEIHTLVTIQAETADRLNQVLQGAKEGYPGEVEHCWNGLATAFEDLREIELLYCAAAGLEYAG